MKNKHKPLNEKHAKALESAVQAQKDRMIRQLFRFAFTFFVATVTWVIGKYLISAPWRPSYFQGRVSVLADLMLAFSVAFLMLIAVYQVKKLADYFCELFAYELALRNHGFNANVFKRTTRTLRPFFYFTMFVIAFALFNPLLVGISKELAYALAVLLALWGIMAIVHALALLTKTHFIPKKYHTPLVLVEDLTEIVDRLTTPEAAEKRLDLAYYHAELAAEEARRAREIFRWKYTNAMLVALSITITAYLAITSNLTMIVNNFGSFGLLGGFLAGFFFTSIITVVPATIVLFELSKTISPYVLAPIAGLGAVITDLFLYSIIKKSVRDTEAIAKKYNLKLPKLDSRLAKILVPIIGGLIVASPLPDEIAVALFGVAKYDWKQFAVLSYVFNTLGILAVGLAAQSL